MEKKTTSRHPNLFLVKVVQIQLMLFNSIITKFIHYVKLSIPFTEPVGMRDSVVKSALAIP